MINTIPVLTTYLLRSPLYLVWLVGIILAIALWSRHPKVSLLTTVALSVLLLASLFGTYIDIRLPLLLHSHGMSTSRLSLLISALSFLRALLHAGAWILLLWAIFGWRKRL